MKYALIGCGRIDDDALWGALCLEWEGRGGAP